MAAVAGLAFVLAACTPTVYKGDIATFSRSVDETARAFNGLVATSSAKYRDLALNDLAEKKKLLAVDPSCTKIYESGILVKDSQCLARWASYRAGVAAAAKDGPPPGPPPSCEGASKSVAAGEPSFYDLASVGAAEAERCRIGVLEDGKIDPQPLEDAETLLVNAPKLLPALQNYANGLAAIADAKDRDDLTTSVGKAKDALVHLAEHVDGMDKKPSPYTAVIGPVSDLFGAALIAGLEQRRFTALNRLTKKADPVVNEAAMVLSNVSMPMVLVQLQDAGTDFTFTLPAKGSKLHNTDQWRREYDAVRQAREKYLAVFETNPTLVFQAMAKAHQELTAALDNPQRQYDSMKDAIETFAEKAKAANAAFEAAHAKAVAEKQKTSETPSQ